MVAIRATFDCVAAAGDEAAAYFYARLFLHEPSLRELFPPAMDEQRDRLFRALARVVESLSSPEELATYLSQLGRDHRKYGVEPRMYEAVGGALIATLRAYAADKFTPAAEQAWLQTYTAGLPRPDDPGRRRRTPPPRPSILDRRGRAHRPVR